MGETTIIITETQAEFPNHIGVPKQTIGILVLGPDKPITHRSVFTPWRICPTNARISIVYVFQSALDWKIIPGIKFR